MKRFKQFPTYSIKAEKGSRIRKGIAAVFGNIDSWGDRIHSGAFSKTIEEGRKRFRHLWNHDSWSPPIAKIVDIKEIGRDELPPEVLEKSPEASGGLMVAREYFEGVPLSDWVLQALDAGEINEMSFGYEIIKAEETEESIGDKTVKIQELKELKLFDTSDVNWGMNSATVADGAKASIPDVPLGLLAQKFADSLERDGEFDDAEKALIWQIATKGLSFFDLPDIGAAPPEEKAGEASEEEAEEEKNEEGAEGKAGAAEKESTPPMSRSFDVPIPYEI